MNNLKRIAKDSILRSDLLSADVSLRFGGSSVYESYCPAIISIITVSVFIAIFIIKFLSVLQLQNITAFQHLVDNIDSSNPVQNIMFAMTIDGLDMNTIDKYFEFTVTEVSLSRPEGSKQPKVRTQREIVLLPCKFDYWEDMGIESMETIFQKRGMSAYYCPTQQFSIQGTSDQDTYIYAEIRLKRCTSAAPFCQKNTTLRDAYYANYVSTNEYFTIKLFIKDTIISPTSQTPISNYLQRDIFLQFSTTTGTVGYIKIADYEIDTDTNILPWTEYETQSGYYIERFQTSSVPSSTKFMYLKLEKSTKKFTVERQYGKLDELLSYIGGLFGLLFYCIEFVMSSYNQYRYQLAIGQTLFNYNKQGQQYKQQDMNFFTYVKYSLYDWLSMCNLNSQKWTQMKTIHETRQQVNEQLDIRYMMNRMRYLQNVIEVLITEQQRVCLMLAELPTMDKLQKVRKVTEFYNKHKDGQRQRNTKTQNSQKQPTQQKDLQNNNYIKYDIRNNKLIQLTEKSINPPRIKSNPSKNDTSLNIKSYNNNQRSLNSISFASNNHISSINQIQGQIIKPNNKQMSLQQNNENDEDNLLIELHQALVKVARNQNDPINNKIIQMLKPQLVKKIIGGQTQYQQNQSKNYQDTQIMFLQLKKQQKNRQNQQQ